MDNRFEITAVWNERCFHHFGIHASLASMYGDDPADIKTLTMQIAEDQTIPPNNDTNMDEDYWGWYDAEKKKFTMIYAKRFLLEMCFPYGINVAEEKESGKAYRLDVINIK